VEFLVTDFRERYGDATRRSRELGMYRQNYCGCRYSEDEAAGQRERRRTERAARKR
jgi:predicted adenine nucleotide alpha hydrolase (AANH) superfamily ATPase